MLHNSANLAEGCPLLPPLPDLVHQGVIYFRLDVPMASSDFSGPQYLGGHIPHGRMGSNQTVPFLVLTASLNNILVVASLSMIACSAFSNMLGAYSVCLKVPKKVKARVPGVTWEHGPCPSVSRCHPSG